MQIIKSLKTISVFLLALFVLQSCGSQSEPGVYKNEKISASNQTLFHDLNSKLFTALKTDDEAQLEYIMSQEFIDMFGKKRQVELVSNRFKEGNYSLLQEYHVVSRFIHGDTINSTLPDGGKYSVFCPGGVKELYIAFFTPKDIANQYLITAVYCKYNYGWKLNQLEADPYTKNGKNAIQLLDVAKASYAKGYFINALTTSAAAINCSRPSALWKYTDEENISKFYNQVLNEVTARYRIPLTIKSAPTHLEIIRIFDQNTPEGDFPMIYYLTNIKLSDTTAIKKENEQIRTVIDKTLPGLDQENKYVFYSAFNEWPTGVKTVDHFDMRQKLK